MSSRGIALVTGASGGIGLELARILARDGYDLALVARSADALATIAREFERDYAIRVLPIVLDLATDDAPRAVVDALAEHNLDAVDVLINNAGFGTFGLFADTDLTTEVEEIHLNVLTLTVLTKLMLPGMLARKRGKIMNVASTAAFLPGPYMAVYFATKHYVLAFSEAISSELAGTGVTVTALCPGPTASGFQRRAALGEGVMAGKMPAARSVAEYGITAMNAGRRVAIPGAGNQIVPFYTRLLPRSIIPALVKRVQTPRRKRA